MESIMEYFDKKYLDYLDKYDFTNCVRVCLTQKNQLGTAAHYYYVPLCGDPESDGQWLQYMDETYELQGRALSEATELISLMLEHAPASSYANTRERGEKMELIAQIIQERDRIYNGYSDVSEFEKTYIVEANPNSRTAGNPQYLARHVLSEKNSKGKGGFGDSVEETDYVKRVLFTRKHTCFSVQEAVAFRSKLHTSFEELYL